MYKLTLCFCTFLTEYRPSRIREGRQRGHVKTIFKA